MTRELWEMPELETAPPPWPLVLELAEHLPPGSWTLVGGVMVHLHAIRAGRSSQRGTRDVDMLLHIETVGSWDQTRAALAKLRFMPRSSLTHNASPHRFVRGDGPSFEQVDVLIADHAAPRALKSRGRDGDLVQAPGGTSTLRKTLNVRSSRAGRAVTFSAPTVFGALVAKASAFTVDQRDPIRHLTDAALLLSILEDPRGIVDDRDLWTGGDRGRMLSLQSSLEKNPLAWEGAGEHDQRARIALDILTELPEPSSAADEPGWS